MILSDKDIFGLQQWHNFLRPYNIRNVQPASVDLTLGRDFIFFNGEFMERADDMDEFWMEPGDFVLATTAETVSLPDFIVGQIAGKSSWMRKGLQVCSDAGYIDPGYSGEVTLELKNLGHESLLLKANQKICQLVIIKTSSPVSMPYGTEALGSHYQGQKGATPAWDAT
jgi:dCTP deaminase